MNESVKETLTSDVEVGTFLSGGIDSSLISAIAQKHSKNKIKTFSLCFEDEDYNEDDGDDTDEEEDDDGDADEDIDEDGAE